MRVPAVFQTAVASPWKSVDVSGSPLVSLVTGARMAHNGDASHAPRGVVAPATKPGPAVRRGHLPRRGGGLHSGPVKLTTAPVSQWATPLSILFWPVQIDRLSAATVSVYGRAGDGRDGRGPAGVRFRRHVRRSARRRRCSQPSIPGAAGCVARTSPRRPSPSRESLERPSG